MTYFHFRVATSFYETFKHENQQKTFSVLFSYENVDEYLHEHKTFLLKLLETTNYLHVLEKQIEINSGGWQLDSLTLITSFAMIVGSLFRWNWFFTLFLTQSIGLYLLHLPSLPVNSPVTFSTINDLGSTRPQSFGLLTSYLAPLGNSNQSVCITQIIPPPFRVHAVGRSFQCGRLQTVGCCHLLREVSCSFIDCRSDLGAAWKLSSRFCYLLVPQSQLFAILLSFGTSVTVILITLESTRFIS